MKTSLTCLGILIVALAIGRWQGSRIEKLGHRMESMPALRATKVSHRAERNDQATYRTKYARRSTGATAIQVFESLVAIPRPRTGVSMGPDVAVDNREAIQTIMQLDLSSLEELMTLISNAAHPALEFPYRKEKAMLCLMAMVDLNPRKAFKHVMDGEAWNRIFAEDTQTKPMLTYVLARMAFEDPQDALDSMFEIQRKSPEAIGDQAVRRLLWQTARYDPGLVLDAIEKLPEAKRPLVRQSLGSELESDDEHTALFHAYRDHFSSQPELMKNALVSLCGRFNYTRDSPPEVRQWMDSLNVTDDEKLLMFDGLKGINISRSDGEEFAKWFAEFMPESKERDTLVWKAFCEWDGSDLPAAAAFLKDQGIDPEEMVRRDMGAR